MIIFQLIIPLISAAVIIYAKIKKVDVIGTFCQCAAEGIKSFSKVLPIIILVLAVSSVFRASGAVTLLTNALSGLLGNIGINPELLTLGILRPISGSGAMSYLSDIIAEYGADGKTATAAAIMATSTETTVYAIAVYTNGKRIKGISKVYIAAFFADMVSFIGAIVVTEIIFGI